jgi:hypothetical protein
MHEGKVFLIDAKSMGELPKTWKVRACEGVDRDTGLPFIVMKRQLPKRADTVLKKEARQKREDATQVKQKNAPINSAKIYSERKVSRKGWAMGREEYRDRQTPPKEEELKRFKGRERPMEINAISNWRSHQEATTPICLAKSHPERKVSRKDCAIGGDKFRACSGKMHEEGELKKFKGQEKPKKILAQGRKTGSLLLKPIDCREKSAENAQSGKLLGKHCASTTGGHSINAAVKKKLMSSKLEWFSINSSGNGRTRLLVPHRANC